MLKITLNEISKKHLSYIKSLTIQRNHENQKKPKKLQRKKQLNQTEIIEALLEKYEDL
jgi:hypothetical protein